MSRVRKGYYSEFARNKSYERVLDDLSEKQRRVLSVIREHQPLSNEEIASILNVFPHTVTPRVLELRQMNLVEFANYGLSPTSNQRVSLWKIKQQPTQTIIDFHT